MEMETLLLGAGASADVPIPTSTQMTERIRQICENDPRQWEAFEVIAYVIGGLRYQQGIKALRGTSGIDVEDLFNAVRFLADRNTSDAAPFVGSWHPRVDQLDSHSWSDPQVLMFLQDYRLDILRRIREGLNVAINRTLVTRAGNRTDPESKEQPDRNPTPARKGDVEIRIGDYFASLSREWSNSINGAAPSHSNLQRAFRDAVEASIPKPMQGAIFQQTARQMIRSLINLTWQRDATRVRYLDPIFNLYRKQRRLTVATLNYDNCIELAAKKNHITCRTGLDTWQVEGTFDQRTGGFRLLKLHGSVDWVREPDSTIGGMLFVDAFRPASDEERSILNDESASVTYEPAVIFGQRNKLTAEGPFLDLLQAFKNELYRCNTLTVIGYSFRDDHINACISQWLNRSSQNRIRVVKRSFPDKPDDPFWVDLYGLGDARFIRVRGSACDALQQLYGSP